MNLWDKISNVGLKGTETDEEKKNFQLMNQIILIACVATPAFIPILYLCGDRFYAAIQFSFSCLFPLCFLFSKKRKFLIGVTITNVLVNINLILAGVLNYNIGAEYLFFPVSLISFTIYKKLKPAITAFIINLICFFLVHILRLYITPVVVLEETSRLVLFYSIILLAFVICAVIIVNFKLVLGRYETSLLKQKEVIEDKQKEIVDSIKYAKRIQKALMPTDKYINKTLNQFNRS